MLSAPTSKAPVALMLIILAAYFPVLENGYVWDDGPHVERNLQLRTLDGLRKIWFDWNATPQYYPLVHTSFWFQYRLWEAAPWGYHLTNVLVHGLNSILVYRIFSHLNLLGAWIAAALFAVHPVHVESVAWISEHKNVLSAAFYLLSLAAGLRFFRLREPAKRDVAYGTLNWHWYFPMLFLYVSALLCKTVTCSLPAALLLMVYWRRGRIRGSEVVAVLPLFFVGIVSGMVTAHLEYVHVGAFGSEFSWSLLERFQIAGRALWFYVVKLLLPIRLTFIYPHWPIDVRSAIAWTYSVTAALVPITLFFLRKRWGRGPLVAVLFFGGTLFPALGFINVYPMRYSFVADHFQYLASLGFFALIATGLTQAWTAVRLWSASARESAAPLPSSDESISVASTQSESLREPDCPPVLLFSLLLAVLVVLTNLQTRVYRDEITLWLDVIAKNPECWMAYNNLGVVQYKQKQYSEARRNIEKSLQYNPESCEALTSMGSVLMVLREPATALVYLRKSVELKPRYALGHFNLAESLSELGRLDEAMIEYRRVLQLSPNMTTAVLGIGNLHFKLKDYKSAEKAFRDVLKEDPKQFHTLMNLGLTLLLSNRPEEALTFIDQAILIRADVPRAHMNRATALKELGRTKEARAELSTILEQFPSDSPEGRWIRDFIESLKDDS